MVSENPYGNYDDELGYAARQSAYADPPSGNAPYGLPGAPYADKADGTIDSTPDPHRTQREAIHDARQNPSTPKAWWRSLFGDRYSRYSVENQTGTHTITQETSAPVTPRPTGIGTPLRPLSGTSPRTYSFTRPMTGRTPKRFNGVHFSMADHKRVGPGNEIYGMTPPRAARGTYRLDPSPWGEQIVDMPATVDYSPDLTLQVPNVPSNGRSYRLG